ncbi:hypothetical protein GQX73_g9348 [Xylaria multiplex]|uniref:Protein kinase domain-containing protein n=1 Tax=Xylaria multiplex TaxID=323545 RepID=A0A7C8II60_9PEZI|nr:hypothetical protein GQX73_g9348 [Xylaria multiplex]
MELSREPSNSEPPLLGGSGRRNPAPTNPRKSSLLNRIRHILRRQSLPRGPPHPPGGVMADELADLFMERASYSAGRHCRRFWSFEILSRILTRERISKALGIEFFEDVGQSRRISSYVNKIGPVYDDDADIIEKGPFYRPPPESKRYLKVFGILVMIEMVQFIYDFIDNSIGDDELPLTHPWLSQERDGVGASKDKSSLDFMLGWPHSRAYHFDDQQWQFLTPFFSLRDRDNHSITTVNHYKLKNDIILPWIKVKGHQFMSASSIIQRVTIDPGSHDFHVIGGSISFSDFAIKSMINEEDKEFAREVEALKRFGFSANSHIITLLCTFEQEDIKHMIFPWAKYNLYEFWTEYSDKFSRTDINNQRWVSSQLLGLADALDEIHNSRDPFGEPFGRHGDIKPDNILWFESTKEPQGIFVLSDLGLAELHDLPTTRRSSTRPIGFTTTYRPPEIDIANVKLSRSLDIWSLGCVFLEMTCWLLGGFEDVQTLLSARTSGSVGIDSGAFFSVRPSRNDEEYTFTVKQEVTEHITLLHRRHNCTQFIHDILDLIQNDMLVINAANRIRSGELLYQLKRMHNQAVDDNGTDYIRKPCPSQRLEQVIPVLEAKVDDKIRDLILKETRAWMTQRFTFRTINIRRSIRVREQPTTTREHNVSPQAAVIESPNLREPNSERTKFESRSGADLDAIAVAQVPSSFPDLPPCGTGCSVIDDVPPSDDTGAFTQSIDTIVRGSLNSSETGAEVHEVAFDITWQIQQCIRDELEGNPDLGPVLTVTGNSLHAWATPCYEYVQMNWKEAARGEEFLMDLEILLGKKFPISEQPPISRLRGTLCSVDEEASGVSRLIFEGTVTEISILGQFLSWIAASFRVPQLDQVACSSVDFWDASKQDGSLPTFGISIRDLRSLDDRPGTCWKALFPSTIMACGFPVPICQGTRGLRIPFDAMLEMAEILYDVNLEDDNGNDTGVYFGGISYTLYPTAYIEDLHTIQWHLEKKHRRDHSDRDHAVAPGSGGGPTWKRISNLETLQSATAILGYCSEVQIQLVTAAQVEHHRDIRPSLSHIENPRPEIVGGSLSMGFSIMGFLNVTTTTLRRPRNNLKRAREAAKEADYIQILDTAEKESLFNIWAFKYANPGPNGGAEARAVLADVNYVRRVVIEKILDSESPKQIGDIIKGIYGAIQSNRARLEWFNALHDGTRDEPFASATVFYEDTNGWLNSWIPSTHVIQSRIQDLERLVRSGMANRFNRNIAYLLFANNLVDYADKYRSMHSVVLHALEAFADVILTAEKGGTWTIPPHFIDSVYHLAGFVMNVSDIMDTKANYFVTPDPSVFFGDVYVLQGDAIIGVMIGMQFRRYPLGRFFSAPDSTPDSAHAPPVATAQSSNRAASNQTQSPKPSTQGTQVNVETVSRTPRYIYYASGGAKPSQGPTPSTTEEAADSTVVKKALDIIASEVDLALQILPTMLTLGI